MQLALPRWRSAVLERLHLALSISQPAVEVLGAAKAIAWGGWLIAHPQLFERYAAFFAPMQSLAPPVVWGGAVGALGLVQCWAILTQHRVIRRAACMAACMGWCGLGWMYAQGDANALGIPLILCEAAAAGWAYLRLGDDYSRGRDGGTE